MSADRAVDQEIKALSDLSRLDLAKRWQKLYRMPPPRGIRRGLMELAIAWHLQTKSYGSLSPALRRQLRQIASDRHPVKSDIRQQAGSKGSGSTVADNIGSSPSSGSRSSSGRIAHSAPPARSLLPGARLIREWHGRTYVVDVIEDGFVFEGKHYASLSAIAREITGARWSGPRFFGL